MEAYVLETYQLPEFQLIAVKEFSEEKQID